MASTEVIQKEVAPDLEVNEIPEVVPKETITSSQSNDPAAAQALDDGQQLQASQQQQQQPPPPTQQQQNQQSAARTRSSREEKMRKKDDKSVDHVLKALNSLNTTEEKLAAMCKKYADIFDENRKLQLALKQAEKRCGTLQREKEQLQGEHSKAILTRSRLENLCRELQRQNKAIKDESLLKIREEEEKRKDVSAKFQATLNEITTLMQQNNDKNMKLRDDNIDMNAKLKNVCEQYELREQQVEKISKQMQLEAQLADAKLAKAKMEMTAEREIMLREKQQLLTELSQYQARCQEFQATEISLRSQISMYDDKYDEFQKALARSNEVFGGFKGEMEKMSKKMCKLEKEVSTWKQRWEGSHRALLEMAEEKQKADQELAHTNRQMLTLQRLCRTLQGERSTLLAKLKGTSLPDEKIDGSTNKIEDVIDNTPLMNLNVQNSINNQLVNGDVTETRSDAIDNLSANKPDTPIEVPAINENGIIELAPSVEGSVQNESLDSKEAVHDSCNKPNCGNSEQTSDQIQSLDNGDSRICQLNEQNVQQKTDLAPLCSSNSSVNNSTTSPENVIINDSSKLPSTPAVTEVGSPIKIVSSNTTLTSSPDKCPLTQSDSVSKLSLESLKSSTSPPVVTETSSAIVTPLPSIEKSVTNASPSFVTPVLSLDDQITNQKDDDKSILDNNKPSVEYTVADVLKTAKVMPTASYENINKPCEEVVSHNNMKMEDVKDCCSTEAKQKSNEHSVKKPSNEPRKGKESRKKKKNT